jgi:hypothetical protein
MGGRPGTHNGSVPEHSKIERCPLLGQPGRPMLSLSISQFAPQRTSLKLARHVRS